MAQQWADTPRDSKCAFEHNMGVPYGENLFYIAPAGSGTAERVVAGWYAEVEKYDFRAGRFDFETGHFTQVVWVRSTKVGCGMAECRDAELWVCNYDPPGNVKGQFAANVRPSTCSNK